MNAIKCRLLARRVVATTNINRPGALVHTLSGREAVEGNAVEDRSHRLVVAVRRAGGVAWERGVEGGPFCGRREKTSGTVCSVPLRHRPQKGHRDLHHAERVPVHRSGQVLASKEPSNRRAVGDEDEGPVQDIRPEAIQTEERRPHLAVGRRPS